MGKKNDAPTQPSAASLTGAQSGLNTSTLQTNNKLNTFDQFAPWGSTVWIRDKQGNPVAQSLQLPEGELDFYNTSSDLRNNLADAALGQSNYLPTDRLSFSGLGNSPQSVKASNMFTRDAMKGMQDYGELSNNIDIDALRGFNNPNMNELRDYNTPNMGAMTEWMGQDGLDAERKRVEDAMYNRNMSLQRKDFDDQYDRMNAELVSRGIPLQSEIDQGQREDFYDRQNEAQERAGMDSIIYGGDEMARLFGMNAQQRAQQFGEQQGLFDMSARQRAQQFGEQQSLYGMSAQQRAQQLSEQQAMSGEQARLFNSLMAQRQNQFGELQAQGAEQSRVAGLQQALRQQAINEMLQKRYEPINLASSFMQGAPSMPTASYQPTPSYQASAPDFMGAAMSNYNTANQNYNNQYNSTMQGLSNLGSAFLGNKGAFGF